MMHDFNRSLALSEAQADAPWWERVYRAAFPDFAAMVYVRKDGWAQRGGIDRVVTLGSGRTVAVDEKVRSRDRGDILLEHWSDEAKRKPGWVAKDLACDFIAYAFVPSQRCYLLPFLPLRRAWELNRAHWIAQAEAEQDGFRVIRAQNRGYVTASVAVPIPDLLSALTDAITISWA